MQFPKPNQIINTSILASPNRNTVLTREYFASSYLSFQLRGAASSSSAIYVGLSIVGDTTTQTPTYGFAFPNGSIGTFSPYSTVDGIGPLTNELLPFTDADIFTVIVDTQYVSFYRNGNLITLTNYPQEDPVPRQYIPNANSGQGYCGFFTFTTTTQSAYNISFAPYASTVNAFNGNLTYPSSNQIDVSTPYFSSNIYDLRSPNISYWKLVNPETPGSYGNINGLTGGIDGRNITIINTASTSQTFANQAAGVTDTTLYLGTSNYTLAPQTGLQLIYVADVSGANSGWVKIGST